MTSTAVNGECISIQEFAAQLRTFPESAFYSGNQVIEFLRSATVNANTLSPYLHWDSQHYTRNLVDKTPLYELIAICWEIGQVSSVHNHEEQNCWMAVPLGRLLVQNYRTISQDLSTRKCQLEPTDKVQMDLQHPCRVDPREPVHRVLNPREFNHRAVSLHIYSRPIDSCVVYSPEQGTCGKIKLQYTTEYGRPAKT
jgi:cysteine dioxygenase